ncbi:tRNA pseudouridine(55) synthase TruB [Hymenobacter oligotrophus]|uniref:tRNA pseudouridine synthase B n=1 Tax=Hymenobacter oligotrophus TaxID=2319843 RepID=A0A3B7QWQ3_9BACT|nr:tRNA pseudouridine(55) synthase TruB [Hymenobacter oligotrophus]AYA35663.1 tRNA pseudouridine(55) synthase TruB [Hymenobacter oligotrophus]
MSQAKQHRHPQPEQEPGEVLLVDKPLHWTSFDVVKKAKYALRPRKIGHAGTLDPLATGLLILCTGKQTKSIDSIQAQEKEYTGVFRLGQITPSYDLETAVTEEKPWEHIALADLQAAAQRLTGLIEQTPPLYSAVKINGERAYELARRGDTAEIKSKTIDIKVFELPEVNGPEVHFRVVCSKGTYIRSLARDFGELLGCGAHLTRLVRTRIGEYRLENALSIADLEARRPPRPEGETDRPPRGPRPERRSNLKYLDTFPPAAAPEAE